MEIIVSLLNKALYMSFFMAIFILVRFTYLFIREFRKPEGEIDMKKVLTMQNILWAAFALAYILTCLFNGIVI
jgi:hypothetical protein